MSFCDDLRFSTQRQFFHGRNSTYVSIATQDTYWHRAVQADFVLPSGPVAIDIAWKSRVIQLPPCQHGGDSLFIRTIDIEYREVGPHKPGAVYISGQPVANKRLQACGQRPGLFDRTLQRGAVQFASQLVEAGCQFDDQQHVADPDDDSNAAGRSGELKWNGEVQEEAGTDEPRIGDCQ